MGRDIFEGLSYTRRFSAILCDPSVRRDMGVGPPVGHVSGCFVFYDNETRTMPNLGPDTFWTKDLQSAIEYFWCNDPNSVISSWANSAGEEWSPEVYVWEDREDRL